MTNAREIFTISYLKSDNPKMVWLKQDPWGYQCSVPADWLREWLDLPDGGADHREGKAWWYTYPPRTYKLPSLAMGD